MPCDYHLLPHPGIQSLVPYVPGKSAEELASEYGISNIIKLASNENPLGCSRFVTQALAELTDKQIATYTRVSNHPLYNNLANKLNIDTNMLILGNGSDTLFLLLMICFALHTDKYIITHDYAFIAYGLQANSLGIPLVTTPLLANWKVDIDAMIAACSEKTALIFFANPNNPTGLSVSLTTIKHLLENIPETTILIIDEAYHEYIINKANSLALLAEHPNLVITRTFSKAYGLAGLRLGYAIANPPIISILKRVQLPFVVNLAALTAGAAALDDNAFIKQTYQTNLKGLKQVKEGLTQLGLTYFPTDGNFITFDCTRDSTPIYQALQKNGIILRPLHPYGLNNYLRVTIGTKQQNTRFLDTLPTCMK